MCPTTPSTSSTTTSPSQETPEQLALSRNATPIRYEIPGWADCKYSNRNIQACILHALPFLAPGANELAASTGKCFHCWALLTSMEYGVLSVIFVLNSIGFAVSFIRYLISTVFSCK
ncbi:hypothetical protein DFP73DRAFT_524685 [Morchella snyderi]|nr:hypothetical protein DFP73DRAFT_524685 [Morchella snyderi]